MSSSVTWPPQGMWADGCAYEQPTSVLRTDESACSSLLRTPQAQVTEAKRGIKLTNRTPADPQVGLADQVTALLPTPTANLYECDQETWEQRPDLRTVVGERMGQPSPDGSECSDDEPLALWTNEDD